LDGPREANPLSEIHDFAICRQHGRSTVPPHEADGLNRISLIVLLVPSLPLWAQYTTPNIITTPGDVTTTLGGTTFTNHGLVGVGRISASALDTCGETFGSVSSLQITNWAGNPATGYTGTFNTLPDRGYNNNNAGGFFSNYAARVQTVDFSFTPYTGAANIGGNDLSSKIAAQNQIAFTSPISGQKFTYLDPTTNTLLTTTGLDPAGGTVSLLGATMLKTPACWSMM
jgi:hypothetical protein